MSDGERFDRDLVTAVRAAMLHHRTGNPVELECLNSADADNLARIMCEFFPDVPACYSWHELAAA